MAPSEGGSPPEKRGLFRKYVLSFLGIVSVVLLTSGLLDGWFSYRETRTTLALVQHSKAEGAAQRIEQFIAEIERQIGWTTHAQWAVGGVDQRRFDYVRLLRQVPAITELVQIDGQGKEQLKVSRLAMDVVASGADYTSDQRYVEATRKRVWYSPVYFRKESEPYMTIAVQRAGRQAGVTLAEVNLKLIWDVVTAIRLGQTGYAYVVDGEGRLIAHPDISLVLRNTDLSKLPQVATARVAGDLRQPEQRATIVPAVDGRNVFSAAAGIPQLGWFVFVETPVNEALAPLYDTLKRTGLLLALGLAVAGLGGVLFARRMLIPVRALAAGAAKLGSGELSHRIEVRTGDELQALGDEFNRMGARLQQSYAGLEQKVADRTAELQQSLEQQTATSDLLRVISASPGALAPVFEAMLESATRICDGNFGIVFRYRDRTFRVEAMRGVPPVYEQELLSEPSYFRDVAPGSAFGRMLERLEPIHVEDLCAGDFYRDR
ncbi:MAG: HAMP domain-containing protein, partial [Alphaproteobacteria bacterium]|nr:HAMP domain-containing protein [Alphaproteobacteria bacterium]